MKPPYPLHNAGQPILLNLANLEMMAFSISGLATYVMIPAFDACFDLGHCTAEAIGIRNLFLSHVHQDHSAGAFRHLALRRMTGHSASKIYVPAESEEAFKAVIRALEAMEHDEPEDLSRVVFPVAAGDKIKLSARYSVIAFDVKHRIASRGYTVIESRKKLRPQYASLSGPEIGAAVARGEVIADYHDYQLFTYIGDSTLQTLQEHPEVGKSEVLFLEATHLGKGHHEVSDKYGHTHLDSLAKLWKEDPRALQSKHIVLKHFSMRYIRDEITEAVDALPKELRAKITILI